MAAAQVADQFSVTAIIVAATVPTLSDCLSDVGFYWWRQVSKVGTREIVRIRLTRSHHPREDRAACCRKMSADIHLSTSRCPDISPALVAATR